MAQVQNDVDRFAGRWMIQDNDHMAEIPQDGKPQSGGRRQAEQGQPAGRQQGGGRQQGEFYYESPRQMH